MRALSRVKSATIAAAFAAAIGGNLIVAAAVAPTLVGFRAHVVTSGSMGRAMPVGSIAITEMVRATAIRPGDIVTYQRPGASAPVTHRVIEAEHDGARTVLTTKGDAVRVEDPTPIRVSEEIARVRFIVPFAGTLVAFGHSPAGWLVFIVLPLLGLLSRRKRGDKGVLVPAI